jgi:VIT1/CCC1 family predicted Fe2+/Mn2+ transporter
MTQHATYPEVHMIGRVGWLRAAVMGANDGIVSTASLILGVAAAGEPKDTVLLSGIAGLVAGAMSMAAGEYVSVSSQAETQKAELERESHELLHQPEFELEELTAIYVQRGLDRSTAEAAARQMMAHDALGTHARDELGMTDVATARPLQAGVVSAATFSVGAALPLLAVLLSPPASMAAIIVIASLACLILLGALGAQAGKAPVGRAILRTGFWGMLAMALTAAIGRLVGTAV